MRKLKLTVYMVHLSLTLNTLMCTGEQQPLRLNPVEVGEVIAAVCSEPSSSTANLMTVSSKFSNNSRKPSMDVAVSVLVKLVIDMYVLDSGTAAPLTLSMLEEMLNSPRLVSKARAFDLILNLGVHAHLLEPLVPGDGSTIEEEYSQDPYFDNEVQLATQGKRKPDYFKKMGNSSAIENFEIWILSILYVILLHLVQNFTMVFSVTVSELMKEHFLHGEVHVSTYSSYPGYSMLGGFKEAAISNCTLMMEEKEESVWASALSCLLYFVCDRRQIRRSRLKGLDIRVSDRFSLLRCDYACFCDLYAPHKWQLVEWNMFTPAVKLGEESLERENKNDGEIKAFLGPGSYVSFVIMVIKMLVQISRRNSWAELLHCKLICMLTNMFYQVPDGSAEAVSNTPLFLVEQVQAIAALTYVDLHGVAWMCLLLERCIAIGVSEYSDDEIRPIAILLSLADAPEALHISVKLGVEGIGELLRRSISAALSRYPNSDQLNMFKRSSSKGRKKKNPSQSLVVDVTDSSILACTLFITVDPAKAGSRLHPRKIPETWASTSILASTMYSPSDYWVLLC
ncbi:unnamed protein product [Ilex paraguariensis]|uniref:Uncharacterized protein n=1 Tax=Ilex paraguariensis TaxID=185542 RepID=A0ABC8SFZ1_9AQUA